MRLFRSPRSTLIARAGHPTATALGSSDARLPVDRVASSVMSVVVPVW
jgi:hypothetical protein